MSKEALFSSEFTIKSDLKYLPWIRQVVSEVAYKYSDKEHIARKCAVIVTEAVDNAVIHAHKKVVDCPITISVTAKEKEIIIEVSDCGKGFVISDKPNWPELTAISGRGIEIMRSMSDDISYKKTSNKNSLIVVVNV